MKEKQPIQTNQDTLAQVLIIDDEESLRKAMAYEIKKVNYGVTMADNGETGCELAKSFPFDIAITDLRMPRMDGIQTLIELKKIDPHIEVIVLTGYATLDTAISCLKQGAYDYLQKPINTTELCLMIEKALEKRRLQNIVSLYEAAQALQSTLNTSQIINYGLSLAKNVADSETVCLVLQSGKRIEIHRGASSIQPSRTMLGKLAEQVINHNRPIQLTRKDTNNPNLEWLDRNIDSIIAFPLAGRDIPLGALILGRREDSPAFSVAEMQRGTIFSVQLALTLHNAKLYQQLEQKLIELDKTRTKLKSTENEFEAVRSEPLKSGNPTNPYRFVINRI